MIAKIAADIARALGGFTRHDDYFESEDYLLSSAVGHLVEIAAPEQYEVKRGKWSFNHLPVIPPHFDLAPIDRSKDRLNLLLLRVGPLLAHGVAQVNPRDGAGHQIGDEAERVGDAVIAIGVDAERHVGGDHGRRLRVDHQRDG